MRTPHLHLPQHRMQHHHAPRRLVHEEVSGDDVQWEAGEGVGQGDGGDDGEFGEDGEAGAEGAAVRFGIMWKQRRSEDVGD